MKKLTILLLVMVLSVTMLSLVACADRRPETIDPIAPKEWTDYIDEYTSYIDNTLGAVDTTKEFYYDYHLTYRNDIGSRAGYEIEATIQGNVIAHGGNGSIIVRNKTLNRGELFAYHDNSDLYINSRDARVRYERAPINDVILKAFMSRGNIRYGSAIASALNTLFKAIFVDGVASLDKSEYTFDIDFGAGIDSIKSIVALTPGVLRDILLSEIGLSTVDELYDMLNGAHGTMVARVADGKVGGLSVKTYNEEGKAIGEFAIDRNKIENGHVNMSLMPIDADTFIKKKLGDLVYEGKMNVMEGNTLITDYDVFINVNIDILELYINDYNLGALGDDNYIHVTISHDTLKAANKAYGEAKYMDAHGAVLELAFSPRDYGNHMAYLIVSPRAFLNREAIEVIDNGVWTDLFCRMMPDYRMITIDTYNMISRRIKSMESEEGMRDIFVALSDYIDSGIEQDGISVDIDYLDILRMFGVTERYVSGIRAMFGDGVHYADRMEFSLKKTEAKSYDIASAATYIIDKDYSATKSYTSYSDSEADPALSWDYYDYVMDGTHKVHNIYDENNTLIYGATTPISEGELAALVGKKIKYSYTNYMGNVKGTDGSLYTDIIDILAREKGADGYEHLAVKVRYPSPWTGLINDNIAGYVDAYLYDIVDIYVKVDKVESCSVDLVSKTKYYYGEILPKDILMGRATLRYKSGSKVIMVEGKAPTLTDFATEGRHNIVFDILGNRYTKYIDIASREENLGSSIVFDYKEVGDSIVLVDGVWNINVMHGDRLRDDNIFNKIRVNIRHTADITTTRPVGRDKIYYEHDGERHYLDKTYRGIWWIDHDGNVVFDREGSYVLTTDADGMTAPSHIVVNVGTAKTEESRYYITDKTQYRPHYFTESVYSFDYGVANAYHGEVGKSNLAINIKLSRGYTNSQGNISYQTVSNISDYVDISKVTISGLSVRDGGAYGEVDLPASIRNNASIAAELTFKTSGYYRVELVVGNYRKKTTAIYVEPFIPAIA